MIVICLRKRPSRKLTTSLSASVRRAINRNVTRGSERTNRSRGRQRTRHEIEALQVAPGVDNVMAIAQPFKLVSRQVKPERTIVRVNGVAIGVRRWS